MKIGIIGAGNVGQELGRGFVRLGYDVIIGTRDSGKLADWLRNVGDKGSVGSFEDTARFGEMIVIATSWSGTEAAINMAGRNNFEGKIVVDVTNPLDFSGGKPGFAASLGNSGGERVQKWLDKSNVVKAFNIITAYRMCNPKMEEGIADLFIAGNDESAKEKVSEIAKKWGWENVYDMGDISQSIWLETLAMLWIQFGFKNNHWTHGFKLLKK